MVIKQFRQIDIHVNSPDGKDHFILVKIYPQRESFRENCERLSAESGENETHEDTMGFHHPYPVREIYDDGQEDRVIIPTILSTICLLDDQIGAGYVSHELSHALFNYIGVFDLYPVENQEHEELCCQELGNWNNQFWNEYLGEGITDKKDGNA